MKKLLLSLFISFVGLISFCSAGTLYSTGGINYYRNDYTYKNVAYGSTYNFSAGSCFFFDNTNCSSNAIFNTLNGLSFKAPYGQYTHICVDFDGYYLNDRSGYSCGFYYLSQFSSFYSSSCPTCPTCPTCDPQYTSEECQSNYGLVSSGVLNECQSNLNSCQSSLSGCQSNLESCQSSLSGRNNTLNNCSNNLLSCESSLASCIQSNCPIDTGDVMWSSLWINGIQHLGKPVINVSIPDNIYWDYTTNDESFDLYVGSGYDQEYIDGIISINSYSPTSEDFTNVFVSGLTLIMPYIIFALFIVFLWKLIKRIFK